MTNTSLSLQPAPSAPDAGVGVTLADVMLRLEADSDIPLRQRRTAGTTAVEEFAATFQKSAGHAPLPYEITGYDAMTVVLAAMKKAGSTDPTATRDALRSLDFQGVLQDYAFNGTNQSSVDININKVTDGHVVPLVSIRS